MSSAILLSVKPLFSNLIIVGEKKVEFRKINIIRMPTFGIVYTSKPIQAITCYFKIRLVDIDIPYSLWEKYHAIGGISKEQFDTYFDSSNRGVAINFDDVKILDRPLKLSTINEGLRPPQSFCYVSPSFVRRVMRYKCHSFS